MSQQRELHGLSKHPGYATWKRMIARCQNKNASHFEYYGGRGIKFAPQWRVFTAFWRDMGPTWRPGLSLDRIDPNGNYEKANCRWADLLTQMRNRRSSHSIPLNGKRMAASEASLHGKVPYATFLARVNRGVDVDKALNEPPASNPKPRAVLVEGQVFPSLSAAGKALGITRAAIFNRLKKGTSSYVA